MTSLADRKALVMGASSPVGMGAAIARAYRDAGAEVAIAARRADALEALAGEIGAQHRACDVTKDDSMASFFGWLNEEFGSLDVAVFATGLNHFSLLGKLDLDGAQACVETQLLGGLRFLKHAASAMNDGGSIILLSSLTADRPAAGTAVYAGTKAAMDQVARVAALEFADRGIRVNSLAPGMTRSEMTEALFANPKLEEAAAREIPLGRLGSAEDVARAALWLADPEGFTTGAVIPVSGGAPLRRIPTFDELMG